MQATQKAHPGEIGEMTRASTSADYAEEALHVDSENSREIAVPEKTLGTKTAFKIYIKAMESFFSLLLW